MQNTNNDYTEINLLVNLNEYTDIKMKYLKIILFWITLLLALGLLIKYTDSGVEGNGIFIIMMGVGLLIGSINALLTYFGYISKQNIYLEAMEMYNGKENINGEVELLIKGKRIILDYRLEQTGIRAAEYIIANHCCPIKIGISNFSYLSV